MSSGSQKCNLGTLISMSCKGRAEAFAQRLHNKLRSLGSNVDDNGAVDESSWLTANENPILSQPRHQDNLLELELPESPASLAEEAEAELHHKIHQDDLRHSSHSDDCQCGAAEHPNRLFKNSTSNDSDSDCSFYDTENEVDARIVNGSVGSEDDGCTSNNRDDDFTSTSESTPQPSSPLSEEVSARGEEEEVECESLIEVSRLEECEIVVYKVDGEAADDDDDATLSTATETPPIDDRLNAAPPACDEAEAAEEDDASTRIPRVRRCSSLKTGQTPPGTPAAKKIVRFADAMGLDLADVRTFLDEVPKVPGSAFEDLPGADLEARQPPPAAARRVLVPLFEQPGGRPDFLDLVRENQVCLENAVVDDPVCLSVCGTVRVRNLDFHKSVHVRYSLDAWRTFADARATYVGNSCDGFSDRFAFLLYAHTLAVGQRLEFACRFQCKGCQYWDSNGGANYCFQCLPASGGGGGGRVSTAFPIDADDATLSDEWATSFWYCEPMRERLMDALASKTAPPTPCRADATAVVVVLMLSFLFFCLQRAIYIL